MIISETWLREWVSPDLTTAELAELLTQAGLEVETVTPQPSLGELVVVGRITAIEKHPDADKLNICRVDVDGEQELTIVCGAPNARKDLVAPVALVGAELPNGMRIGERKVRGVFSSGMICSAAELGLEEQSDGLMELDSDAPVGRRLEDYLALADVSIDIDLTPDRGDCLSIAGVARDISAMSHTPLTPPALEPVAAEITDRMTVELRAPTACARYAGRIIKGVNLNAVTPDAMKEKLRRVGLRSISPIVDVTNYVMMELGQPMHAFDLNKLSGGIIVRMGEAGETLTLLDGQEIELEDDMLVIADQQKPVALAGIMGGGNSEIDDQTSDILLESAYFAPLAIAGKARSLGLQTDASHRFERGVDTHLQVVAIERATELLLGIVGGQPGPVFDECDAAHMPEIETISLRPQRVRDMLGLDVPDDTIRQHLLDLDMGVQSESLPWAVTRPSWRFDLTGEHDLVEEIGRLEGLDKIEPKAPTLRGLPHTDREQQVDEHALRSWLADRAYREVVCYSFIDPGDQLHGLESVFSENRPVDIANPIASNMAQMRMSLLPGLLNAARANEQRQHNRIRLFEMGHIFSADETSDTGAFEQNRVAMLAGGEQNATFWAGHGRKTDFFDLKGDLDQVFDRIGLLSRISYRAAPELQPLHPGQAASIYLDGEAVGFIGVLHPQMQKQFDLNQAYVVAELRLLAMSERAITEFRNLSKFPETTRDLALIVEKGVSAADILGEIEDNIGKLLKKCEVFDNYMGESIPLGMKSLAFNLVFQSPSDSLENELVDNMINKLLDSLQTKYGATLRS